MGTTSESGCLMYRRQFLKTVASLVAFPLVIYNTFANRTLLTLPRTIEVDTNNWQRFISSTARVNSVAFRGWPPRTLEIRDCRWREGQPVRVTIDRARSADAVIYEWDRPVVFQLKEGVDFHELFNV